MTAINFPNTSSSSQHVSSSRPDEPPPLAPVTPLIAADPLNNPAALKAAFADRCNWQALAQKLQTLIKDLRVKFAQASVASNIAVPPGLERALASLLSTLTLHVCEDSTYSSPLSATRLTSLASFMSTTGIKIPETLAELISLYNATVKRSQAHPLGNFSGALCWPMPMSQQDQHRITALLGSNISGLPGLPLEDTAKGALGYLLSGSPVTEADLKSPTVAIEKLLGSAKAQALGQAIQTTLNGIPTDTSLNDYVLTAIHLGLDPESLQSPSRHKVAGFDLDAPQHWGQPATAVIDALARHLTEKGRATAQTANLAARLLLAKRAPEYLVKDVPSSVPYGSVMWTQLAIAVAKLETDAPGRVLSMSYADVLASAQSLRSHPHAQRDALLDWAVVNGLRTVTDAVPTSDEVERIRTAFNGQLNALITTSTLQQTAIPNRRAMALAQLKQAFPEVEESVFEAATLQKVFIKPGRRGAYPGMRSMLDIVMEGETLGPQDHWWTQDKRIPVQSFCDVYTAGKLGVTDTFKSAYEHATSAHAEGHKGMVQHLLAKLPLEDRKNLEYGKLEFFHTNDYQLAMDLSTPAALKTRGHTLEVKTTRDGHVDLYVINTQKGTVEKINYLRRYRTPPYTTEKLTTRNASIESRTVLYDPYKDARSRQSEEQSDVSAVPPGLNSKRSAYIADVFVKSLDLENDDLLKQARGVTSYDQEAARNSAIGQFFLNLIPFRSAIVNFTNGNIGDGLFDLSLDVIGLVTLGVGKAAQAGKALGKGISSISQLTKAARFIGATAIEAINPLSGVGDLVSGGGRLAINGGRYVSTQARRQLHQLKGTTGSYDLLKAASKHYDEAATGAVTLAGDSVKGGAVRWKGKWYSYDADKRRPYGSPLEHFTAKTRAVGGIITPGQVRGELSNQVFAAYQIPEARIAGHLRNSQGAYVAADGHVSHIRHTDSTGQTAVYEVRQLTRTEDGVIQARIYHNNRQTELLVQHVEGDQWRRVGADGGYDTPPSSPGSVSSDASSSRGYSPYPDDVIRTNPYQAQVTLPAGGAFNSRGMIERTDVPKLYRVEQSSRVQRRGDPTASGFIHSNNFSGPEKMLDGDVVIVSRSKEGAEHFGATEFGGDYELYEIDSTGLRAVSLNENIDLNPQFTAVRQDDEPDWLDWLKQENQLCDFAGGAHAFDEVHLSVAGLDPARIKHIPKS